jgi:hypothetical protein
MPCSAADNSINVAIPPPPNIPGFGPAVAPLGYTIPGFELPTEFIEDILALTQQLGALFPSGLFKPNFDGGMKDVLDGIANLLSQLAPFLSFYNFILAALRLIVCIIEVLCAIPNPFAVASKLKVLFAECLPPFLNLFPYFALIAMILALLLLILALIQYIVQVVIALIQELLANLLVFADAQALQDGQAAIAIATKIASLLCILENILAILIAIAAIIQIIQALAQFGGIAICDEADDTGCCAPEICPPFIRDNFEIPVTTGELVYYSKIEPDLSSLGLPATLLPLVASNISLRQERWQLFDTDTDPNIPIASIITPTLANFFGGQAFWPPQDFTAETRPQNAPWTVDLTLTVDPGIWNPSDTGGAREFTITDCIVVRQPYVGLVPWNNSPLGGTTGIPIPNGTTGTFNIEGGLVFEADGSEYQINKVAKSGIDGVVSVSGNQASLSSASVTFDASSDVGRSVVLTSGADQGQYVITAIINGSLVFSNPDGGFIGGSGVNFEVVDVEQATLNSFIFEPPQSLDNFPAVDDGYVVEDVQFNWKPNHAALAGYNLITVGCFPGVTVEKAAVNAFQAAQGIEPVIERLPDAPDGQRFPSTGALPNITGAQECIQNAINQLRTDINADTVADFQAEVETCLADLQNQTLFTYCNTLLAGVSIFQSSFSLDTDLQFTTRPINLSIILRDAGGTVISNNIPEECLDDILNALEGEITLGVLSDFTYDSTNGTFDATIVSENVGQGEVRMLFNGQVFSDFIEGPDFDTPSEIQETVIPYEFVADVDQPAERRDATDVAQGGTE